MTDKQWSDIEKRFGKIADFILENYFTENGFARDYDEALRGASAICAVFAQEIKKMIVKNAKYPHDRGYNEAILDLLTTLEEGK